MEPSLNVKDEPVFHENIQEASSWNVDQNSGLPVKQEEYIPHVEANNAHQICSQGPQYQQSGQMNQVQNETLPYSDQPYGHPSINQNPYYNPPSHSEYHPSYGPVPMMPPSGDQHYNYQEDPSQNPNYQHHPDMSMQNYQHYPPMQNMVPPMHAYPNNPQWHPQPYQPWPQQPVNSMSPYPDVTLNGPPGHYPPPPENDTGQAVQDDVSKKRKNKRQSQDSESKGKRGPKKKTVKDEVKVEPAELKPDIEENTGGKKKSKKKSSSPRKKIDRFDGIPEEEVAKKLLPDHLAPNLDILIIGINPGLFAAHKGHHYAGPGNHFWQCLYLSGLIPEPFTANDDFRLLDFGIGFTNMVARTTKGSADLTREEIKEGSKILLIKIKIFKPKIAVFNGKGIYEVFSGKKQFMLGKQPEKIEGTDTYIWVMPSSSARCAQLPRAMDKVPFYVALKKYRDYLRGDIPSISEEEIVFSTWKLPNFKQGKKSDTDGETKPSETHEIASDDPCSIKKEEGESAEESNDGAVSEGGSSQLNGRDESSQSASEDADEADKCSMYSTPAAEGSLEEAVELHRNVTETSDAAHSQPPRKSTPAERSNTSGR